MNYMKFFYNQKIHHFYDYKVQLFEPNDNPIIWIYRLFNCLDQEVVGCRYSTKRFMQDIKDPGFTGIGFDFDISIERSPKNNFWYIYYSDPVIESSTARDSHGNFLLWDEDKIFDLLTPQNSLKISQENLLEVLELWKKIMTTKPRSPFLLIWQDDKEWMRMESFASELAMNERIKKLEEQKLSAE